MKRSSKLLLILGSALHLGGLGFVLSAAEPVPLADPNVYAPTGYFTELSRQLQSAAKSGQLVSILQLGDSHIQPGAMTQPLRTKLQQRYGNAGRGWTGWYSLYGSFAPKDYRVSSTGLGWSRELILKPRGEHPMGIGGYVLSPKSSGGYSITLSSVANPFTRMLVVRSASSSPLESFPPAQLRTGQFSTGAYVVDTLSWGLSAMTEVSLSPREENAGDELAGAVLLSGRGGVLVNDIGIAGAAYRHYNNPEFVEQLTLLHPQLVIISLGTNDGYYPSFDLCQFTPQLDRMIELVKSYLPQARILLTTPPPSFFRIAQTRYVTVGGSSKGASKRKGKRHRKPRTKKVTTISYRYNDHSRLIAAELMRYAREHGLAAFDLYSAMGGQEGIQFWIDQGLMGSDRVHYSTEGYRQQGELLTSALLSILDNHRQDPDR